MGDGEGGIKDVSDSSLGDGKNSGNFVRETDSKGNLEIENKVQHLRY